MKKDKFIISKKNFSSRLIVGTGKYKSMQECAKAIKLSGAEIVTVAVRRVNITDKKKPLLMDYIDPKKITYLPNTAGCFNSKATFVKGILFFLIILNNVDLLLIVFNFPFNFIFIFFFIVYKS